MKLNSCVYPVLYEAMNIHVTAFHSPRKKFNVHYDNTPVKGNAFFFPFFFFFFFFFFVTVKMAIFTRKKNDGGCSNKYPQYMF